MRRIFHLFTLCLLMGCISPITEEREDVTDTTHRVCIFTRSASSVSYPLTLYAFRSQDGTLAASATQSTAQDDPILHLSQGNYEVVALAGTNGCDIPTSPTLSSIIAAPTDGLFASPLQMGSASLSVLQNTTTSIMLHNQSTAILLSLYDLPADVTSATVSLSLMASGLSFDGRLTGNATTTVPLIKEGEAWCSQPFFTLPSMGDHLTLSIATATSSEAKVYGYTYPSPLQANTPYILSGSLHAGFTVNGAISLEGWNETETILFTFDSEGGGNNNKDTISTNKDDVFEVEEIPAVGTLWNGYFVAGYADSDDATERMLLLSATEWTEITGATHETTPHMAAEIADTYTEGGLSGWHIPTRNEVRKLCATLGSTSLDTTNAFLTENGLVPLSYGESIRYLCDDAKFSFRWDSEGKPSAVGTKRTYHLRLVRTVGFIVK